MIAIEDLRADCTRCAGLCCVIPAFARSADFAFAKPAGTPCPNLQADHRCGIHAELRDRGMAGCTVFDCFGAGQALTGRSGPVAAAFPQLRALHELLRYLLEAQRLAPGPELADAVAATVDLTRLEPAALAALDVDAHRRAVNPLLVRVSEAVRGSGAGGRGAGGRGAEGRGQRRGVGRRGRGADLSGADAHGADRVGPDHRGADLMGADLRGADLRAGSLRGALLVGADLRGADLRGADVTGADLRGARLDGADLRGALFLVPPQLTAARGDAATRLPAGFERPAHWTAGGAAVRSSSAPAARSGPVPAAQSGPTPAAQPGPAPAAQSGSAATAPSGSARRRRRSSAP